ncbi:serine/threonine kinase PKN8 [Plesiocystis pacifica SIR-1]|uniref:Serine/threonine kinase PKN8 n=1 Tax=Plesiocystis pacifica SIR-1 TaxID=391625 RepID=A6G8J7_9BACT|nr:serine/threonine-protein kinase [Plesiocystis pacifica]EDM77774.1 serine/threonine kinase PKN8 [Plesiocystis pacifica SIR-1]
MGTHDESGEHPRNELPSFSDWLALEDDEEREDVLLPESQWAPDRWVDLVARIDAPLMRQRNGEEDVELFCIDRYMLDDVLGYGGMGVVARGWDPELGRCVAIKLCLNPGELGEEALRREAMTLAQLRHPNIVAVHDIGRFEDSLYIVMDYVEGLDGREWLRRRLDVGEICRVFRGACLGLDAAHRAGILHGDFKPSNILVGVGGEVCVADFGVAELIGFDGESGDGEGDEEWSTPRGGTLAYMAPERLCGHRGDARADQFSLCVSMWQALHGVRPFAGSSAEELLEAIERGEIERGDEHGVEAIPEPLSRAVLRGLRADPEERHPNLGPLMDAVTLAGGKSSAPEWYRGRGLQALLTLGVMAGSFAVSLSWLWWALGQPRVADQVSHAAVRAEAAMPARSAVDVAIALIRAGKHQDGLTVWEAEQGRREANGEPFAEEGLRVGAALLERGNDVFEENPKLSAKLASVVISIGESATVELGKSGQPTESARRLTRKALALQRLSSVTPD